MSSIKFYDSRWPILYVEYPSVLDDEAWRRHLDKMIAYAKSGEPYGMVLSVGESKPTAAQRRLTVESIKEHEADFRRCVGQATVIESALQRGVITAYIWLLGENLPFPVKIVGSIEEGTAWLKQRLSDGA